jgi:hypothetical protein
MNNPRTDGDALTLQALSDALGVTVLIIRSYSPAPGAPPELSTATLTPRPLPFELLPAAALRALTQIRQRTFGRVVALCHIGDEVHFK